MPKITIGFGVALIVLGLVGFSLATAKAFTSLIPSGFGAVLVICGLIALKDSLRMHAMHGAAVVALLGAVGALVPLIIRFSQLSTLAMSIQIGMLVLCAGFVVVCVQSFIAARKARQAAEAAE